MVHISTVDLLSIRTAFQVTFDEALIKQVEFKCSEIIYDTPV